MNKFLRAAALAFAAVPILGFSMPALADSPGQLSNGPDNYKVRNVTQNGAYAASTTLACGDVVKYSVTLSNSDFGLLTNLMVSANSNSGAINASATNVLGQQTAASGNVTVNKPSNATLTYIPGTTVRITSDGQTRTPLADGVFSGSVNAGNLNGSTSTFVQFEARAVCQVAPQALTCSNLTVTVIATDRREVSAQVTSETTNGATVSGYSINFGDGTAVVNQQSANHTYAANGTYTVSASVNGTADGQPVISGGGNCVKTVTVNAPTPPTPTIKVCEIATKKIVTINEADFNATKYSKDLAVCNTTPSVLPNTGAGALLGLFSAATAASTIGYRVWVSRRLQ